MIASACSLLLAMHAAQAPTVEVTVAAYVEAWNEPNEVMRTALLELSFAKDGTYEDPQSRFEGRDALFEGIGSFLERNPGARLAIASGMDSHHDKVRFRWRLVGADGAIVTEGMDYGELAEDGRIQHIVGFFGPFPDLP